MLNTKNYLYKRTKNPQYFNVNSALQKWFNQKENWKEQLFLGLILTYVYEE